MSDPYSQFVTVPAAETADPYASFLTKPKSDQPRGLVDNLLGLTGERKQILPERMVRGAVNSIVSGATLAGDALAGKAKLPSSGAVPGSVEFGDPESAGLRVADLAMMASPANPGSVAGGRVFFPGASDLAPKPGVVVQPNVRAAQTAVELGAPLPKGIATENSGIQAVTQGSRQLPYVGQKIEERLAATGEAASTKLATETQELAKGITARPDVGESLRDPMSGIIKANKSQIDQAFGELRSVINPDAPTLPRNLAEALIEVGKSRMGSGWDKPGSGLENLINLVHNRASFNGLQRARTELAETMDWGAAHGGFTTGDKKRIMGAISKDMEDAVVQTAGANKLSGPGVSPQSINDVRAEALGKFHEANKTFQRLAPENEQVATLLKTERDSLLAGKIISAANGKTGDPVLLARLKKGLPGEDFDRVAGTVLSELGKNQSSEFSLNLFSKSWAQLGERQKSVLFGNRKQLYDDIAQLSSYVKGTEQYRNTSNTGRAGSIAAVLSMVGTGAATTVATGSVLPIAAAVGTLAGGYALAKALASPAGAAAVARMSRAAKNYSAAPSVANRATLLLTARDANKTLEGLGSSGSELFRQLKSPLQTAAEPEQPGS